MLTKEDLEKIGGLIDEKLDIKLAPIKNDINRLTGDVDQIKSTLSYMDTTLSNLKTTTESMNTRLYKLEGRVVNLDLKFSQYLIDSSYKIPHQTLVMP